MTSVERPATASSVRRQTRLRSGLRPLSGRPASAAADSGAGSRLGQAGYQRADSSRRPDSAASQHTAEKPRDDGYMHLSPPAIPHSKLFADLPPRALEPKVLLPFQHVRGRVSRKIEVERRRRLYETQDISELCRVAGLTLDEIGGREGQLPLETFDDSCFDSRTAREWMELAFDGVPENSNSDRHYVPAKGLRIVRSEGQAGYQYCRVVDWNEERSMLRVLWGAAPDARKGEQSEWLSRIHVCFLAEDPTRYVQRLAHACKLRKRAMEWLRYKLHCDSMPILDVVKPDRSIVEKIVTLGTNIRSLPQEERMKIVDQEQALVDEFKLDWCRSMNRAMLEEKMQKERALRQQELSERAADTHTPLVSEVAGELSHDVLVKGPADEQHPSPLDSINCVSAEARRQFQQGNRLFHFSTYFTSPEVIRSLSAVKSVCQNVLKGSLFDLPRDRHMSLQEFERRQIDAIESMSEYLKTEWKDTLRQCVVHFIRDVGKGWLNLDEQSQEIYEISKLKRFLTTVKYIMEDTLHFLVLNSLASYVEFIEDVSNFTVVIKDMYTVNNSWPGSDDPAAITKTPLFTLELVEREGNFSYSTPTDLFEQKVLALFDKAIVSTHEIPQLEKFVMNRYFWPEEKGREDAPYCDSVDPADPRVRDMRQRAEDAIRASLNPLDVYKETYFKYSDIVRLDKDDYVREFKDAFDDPENGEGGRKNPTDDLAAEIKKQERRKKEVRKEIPHYVEVGNFFVDCTTFRSTMEKKHEELKRCIEDLIKTVAKEKARMIRDQFTKMNAQVNKQVQTVEALFQTRELIRKDIPERVYQAPDGLIHKIDEMKVFYSVLEQFQCQLPDEDFRNKWEAIYWPKKLEITTENIWKRLEAEGEKLHDAMLLEQEEFKKEIEKLGREVQKYSSHSDLGDEKNDVAQKLAAECKVLQKRIEDAREKSADFNKKQELFGDDVINYGAIHAISKEFKSYYQLWITTNDWQQWSRLWRKDAFESLDADDMRRNTDQAERTIKQLAKAFKDKPQWRIVEEMRNQITEFQPMVPIISAMRNPGMRDRHWEDLAMKVNQAACRNVFHTEVGADPPADQIHTIEDIEERDLVQYKDVILKVCEVAAKEYGIESALNDMQRKWQDVNFIIEEYKNTRTYMMKGADEVQVRLDEDINLTQQLTFSPFKAHFEERIAEWDKQLSLVSEILEQWLECQRNWLYLQPIFSAEDIQMQLPVLSKRFEKVDRTWRKVLSNAHQEPNALTFCTKSTKLLDQFINCNKDLEVVLKGLNDYLGEKRQCFGRFYFLSDEELLEILSQARDPRTIDLHIPKLIEFMNSMSWECPVGEKSAEEDGMTGWVSSEGEKIAFAETVYPRGNVEVWLVTVQDGMKLGLHKALTTSNEEYPQRPRKEWVLSNAGQIIIAVSQIWWTLEIEQALESSGLAGLRQYSAKSEEQLLELVDVVQSPLSRMQRVNMGALITIEVHAKDTTVQMVESATSRITDFDWIKQLRYYYNTETARCDIKQVDALFEYGGEYLGNTMRLVVTPLTDRIYLTLTGALALHLGGAPAGPAGTGKTETTKDLAKALAKQCVVFNCQEGLDFRAMGKFFKGLAMTGAWACFDEFNRIDVEVLSVVAQQVSDLQEACKRKQYRIDFEGSEIFVDRTHAVFITMNPGYAGRTELPDNLKVLFRPVACMVPDYALIGEIRLFSYGYKQARPLSKKMVQTFQLSSEQLSSQDHYDFGMRAVNTVITAAGINKRENPTGDEDLLLLRSLRDSNVPKFLQADIVLFENIILDLFPGAQLPKVDYGILTTALSEACSFFGLQPVPEFLKKCIQLYEVTVLRHGLMLVGPTGSGKTSNKRVLQRAMTQINSAKKQTEETLKYSRVRTHICNPKCITMNQLYGAYDESTHEWSDGVLCVLFRRASKDLSGAKQWVVFDGPVDALWIESMNTVLDENKKLCLVSGEIIQMSRYMTMFFEVEDLAVASPATVSRCGMIYMEPQSCTPTKDRIESWLEKVPASHKPMIDFLKDMATKYLDKCIKFVRLHCSEYLPTVDNNLISSFFRLMNNFMRMWAELSTSGVYPAEDAAAMIQANTVNYFFLSLVWSIGATVTYECRPKFHEFLVGLMEEHEEAVLSDWPAEYSGTAAMVYDHFYEHDEDKVKGWKSWLSTQRQASVNPIDHFADITVSTKDSIRGAYFLKQCILNNQHVLATGPTGTGKTMTLQNLIMHDLPDKFMGVFVTFSAQTHANQVQNTLMGKFDKRKNSIERKVWGPPVGKTFVVLVDDTNMPLKEKYGAQPPIELLRQFLDHEGFYSFTPPIVFNEVVDLSLSLTLGPPGGGRQPVSNRFLRHFNHIAFPEMDDEAMTHIFGTIIRTKFGPGGNDFPADIANLADGIVVATLRLFNFASKNYLPTPNHVHYTFNLRDVAKVFALIYAAEARTITSMQTMIRLWMHECSRVFRDRLVCDEDRKLFDTHIDTSLKEVFMLTEGTQELVPSGNLIWGDFMSPGDDVDARAYDEVTDMSAFVGQVSQYLEDYNDHSSPDRPAMPLVIFLNAAEHVARISRILRMPAGHALLLGVGGSGRRSLTRLAAYIPELEVFYLEITKAFTMNDWRDALRRLMSEAAMEDKGTVFLFTDTQIVKPAFMEDVAALLGTADVANLFDGPELDNIYNFYRNVCQAERLPTTKISLYARFVKQVRLNLHVVLAFSPVGEAFRTRMRQFPSLANCCTIDWYDPWPKEALKSVAKDTFSKNDFKIVLPGTVEDPEATEDNVYKIFAAVHQSAQDLTGQFFQERRRHSYVTPSSYLGLIGAFKGMLQSMRTGVTQSKQRLLNGLSKLHETEEQVADLQQRLKDQQPELQKKQEDVKVMMEQLEVQTKEAEVVGAAAKEDQDKAEEKRGHCKGIKDAAKAMLDQALPLLDDARKVLRNLQVSHLKEVGKYNTPPDGVRLVMQAVLTVKGIGPNKISKGGAKEEDWWGPARDLLRDAGGLHEWMLSYDAAQMPPELVRKLAKFIEDERFSPPVVKTVSVPCAGMCQWVHAMYKYYHVNLEVEPKRVELAEAEKELKVVEDALAITKEKSDAAQARIAELKYNCERTLQEQKDLIAEVARTEARLERAGRLIDGLSGEKGRWVELVAKYEEDEKTVLGDVIIACGYVAYLGVYTAEYRQKMAQLWAQECDKLSIRHSEHYYLVDTHGDPVQIQQWVVQGLPSDTLSTENAVILSKALSECNRWPLMIDPQGQANGWIRNMEGKDGDPSRPPLVVTRVSDPLYAQHLSAAIRNGAACLLENVQEDLDPLLEPILLKQTFMAGSTTMIKCGDSAIPFDDNFRLYITTKLPNPHYTPETSVKVALLNFFITPSGLEDQLLGKLVGKERKDLEDEKNALTRSNAAMLKELKDLQENILRMLQESEGEILDNEVLIETLEKSKLKSVEINAAVAQAKETEVIIDETRNKYRPVAFRASILFFCVAALSAVDPMYQYSLQWFMSLFLNGIDKAEPSEDLDERLENLLSFFTYSFYTNVCRSLFEKHKLTFSFSLCCTIIRPLGKIDESEYRFFLTGPTGVGGSKPNPAADWCTDATWDAIQFISAHLPSFAAFDQHFSEHVDHYKMIFDSAEPHREAMQDVFESKMTPLMRLVFTRVLRADKVLLGVQDYVRTYVEEKYIISPTFDLEAAYRDSDCATPLIFILSPGADPMDELQKFAAKMRMQNKMHPISLGQGQGPRATQLVEQGKERGTWVVLQNCHLATSWMPKMENLIENFSPDAIKREFRLWLTSMPNPNFPVSVLQIGVKMTNEPPRGLRANLTRAFTGFSDDFLEDCKTPQKVAAFKKLLFSLCLFHSVIQDRRTFGPLGFNIPYEFNDSDLKVCQTQLQKFINMYDDIPFPVLHFLTGQINYGGRVTDDLDRRCLMTMLDDYISPPVLKEGYYFSPSGAFQTTEPGNRTYYLEYMMSRPLNAEPEAFGLHDNGSITSALNLTFALLSTVLSMETGGGGGGGRSRDEALQQTASELLRRTPPEFEDRAFQEKYPVLYEESMNTVLVQESLRYNKLLRVMAVSLRAFGRALRGEVVMSGDLEQMGTSMMNNQVPEKWAAVAYPSIKPLSGWFEDLLLRAQFIQNWFTGGHPPVYWLSGLFFPQGFLTGSKQNFARSQKISIDRVSFSTHLLKQPRAQLDKAPTAGVYVDGLFMEGARWDDEKASIVESRPKELFTSMPVFWFEPVADRKPPSQQYICPLYKTLTRAGVLSTTGHSTNFVLRLEVPTNVPDRHWIKRGVACFLSLRE